MLADCGYCFRCTPLCRGYSGCVRACMMGLVVCCDVASAWRGLFLTERHVSLSRCVCVCECMCVISLVLVGRVPWSYFVVFLFAVVCVCNCAMRRCCTDALTLCCPARWTCRLSALSAWRLLCVSHPLVRAIPPSNTDVSGFRPACGAGRTYPSTHIPYSLVASDGIDRGDKPCVEQY